MGKLKLYPKEAKEAGRPALLVLERHGESFRQKIKGNNAYLPELDKGSKDLELALSTPDDEIPLTELGEKQALATGPHIRRLYGVFDCAMHSGYVRTVNTLNLGLEAYTQEERSKMKIRSHHWLSERHPGYTYGMTDKQVKKYFPWLEKSWNLFGPFRFQPPGGESHFHVCTRSYQMIGIFFQQRAGCKLWVSCHGGVILGIRFNLEKWTADTYVANYKLDPPKNCGLTTYVFQPDSGRLELESYNQTYY